MTMRKRGMDRIPNYSNKKVLMRVDFNVPLKNGEVADDFRIRAVLPTIKKVTNENGKLILISHLGRPNGEVKSELSLKPVAKVLSEMLDREVVIADDVIGESAQKAVENMEGGEVVLLENLRFHEGEKANDKEFAKKLASLADLYINDAFACSHREHASVAAITEFLPSYAGFLLLKEMNFLSYLKHPENPYIAILGGAKVGDKLPLIKSLIEVVDKVLIGGGMAYTFLKGQGKEVGKSLVDDENVDACKKLLKNYEEKIRLPQDHVVANELSEKAETRVVEEISSDEVAGDIGPQTVRAFSKILSVAKTVVWNGPLGVYEMSPFASGTEEMAKTLAGLDDQVMDIVGGGDVAAALRKFGLEKEVRFVSTGGGAFVELISGEALPGIEALPNAEVGE